MRRILLTGGAPQVGVDAVRYFSGRATGGTSVALARRLRERGLEVDLLLGELASPQEPALRFRERGDLDDGVRTWIGRHPDGVVVMAAAVNDYTVARVESVRGGIPQIHAPGSKVPSQADEVRVVLRPAAKLIEQLRPWGLAGPIVAFKYEAADTVLASAEALRRRTGAMLVVANSLDAEIQALVDARGVEHCHERRILLDRLGERLLALALGR